MSIWVHHAIGEVPSIGEIAGLQCRFCDGVLVKVQIEDRWVGVPITLPYLHQQTVIEMAETHGDFILRELEIVDEPDERPAFLCICPLCGWWHVSKEIYLRTRNQTWFVEYGVAASLRKFDQVDIRLPANEVRQYLIANYEHRYNVHPRRFEEVVASVFSSFGFKAEVTAYSGDGGIDVIIRNYQNQAIAVQVKRHKGTIEVSSVRELLGAMVLNGYTKGAFVTTSRFQAGGMETMNQALSRGLCIDLIDGESFLKKLRIAQMNDFMRYPQLISSSIIDALELELGNELHCRAL